MHILLASNAYALALSQIGLNFTFDIVIDKMPAVKCFLKLSEEPIIASPPARKIICFSIMSFLCHRGTPGNGCEHSIHRFPPFMPCELLIPFLSVSHR